MSKKQTKSLKERARDIIIDFCCVNGYYQNNIDEFARRITNLVRKEVAKTKRKMVLDGQDQILG